MPLPALLCGLLLGSLAAPASAQSNAGIDRVVVGFGGHWKVGEWAPVRVQVRLPKPSKVALVVTCPDADENLTDIPSELQDVASGGWVQGSFKSGRLRGDLQLRIVDAQKQVLATTRVQQPGLRLNAMIWGVLGEPGGLEGIPKAALPGEASPIVVRLRPEELPRHAHALAGLDAMIVDADPQRLQEIEPLQNEALRDWVRNGGELLVGVGGEALRAELPGHVPPFLVPAEGRTSLPIADWVPVRALGQVEVRQLSGIESYVGQAAPLRFTGAVDAPRLADVSGNVLVSGTFGPMLVRVPFGFGRIVFLGLDLSKPPLSTWTGLSRLYRRVLTLRRPQAVQRSGQITGGGSTDLATQLHGAQEDFPAVQRVSYFRVLGYLLLAVVIVGPLDYVLVTRLLRRPTWTWITLPVFVIAACAGLQALAVSGNGSRQLINELDLVDIDLASQTARGRAWLSVYSPISRRYDVTVDPRNVLRSPVPRPAPRNRAKPNARRETMLSWSALPEESLGGIYRSGGVNLTQRSYLFDGATAGLLNVPVTQWSTKSLVAEWTQPVDVAVDSRLERTSLGRLSGSLSHRLPEALEDCILVHGGHVYAPPRGRLAPAQLWQPSNARGLKSVLTNARTVASQREGRLGQDYITQADPWSPQNHDRDRLVRILSFHEAADGSRYTGLEHVALGRLELTPVLDFDRAVLVGRIRISPVQWTINGSPAAATEQHTFLRLVLPVARSLQQDAGADRPFIDDRDERLKKEGEDK